ncbi:MAG: S8 family serine peptidase, partial [Leadbetterella sp.]
VGVDLFAPGVAIYSSVPGSKYREFDGTSMASPVSAGIAALVKSYFPTLTATEIKDILIKSVTPLSDLDVSTPGNAGKKVKFGEISQSGGVINAYNAVKLALEIEATKKQ